jgi:hypothetical protein
LCDTGYSLCGNSCVDTDTDDAHCGSCTTMCNGARHCVAGTCKKT